MKKTIYEILVVMVLTIILLTITVPINATTSMKEENYLKQEETILKVSDRHTAGEIIKSGDSFTQIGSDHASDIFSTSELHDLSSTIYNILLVVGIVIAVLLGAVLGIKFMMEGAEGKAEVQKALVPYVIGCIVIFGAFAIWKIVVTVLQGL